MNRRVSVRGLALLDGKILAVQLKPYNKYVVAMNGAWCLPGGGLDPGEGLIAGVRREMLEETGVAAEVGNLLYIQQFISDDSETLEFIFHITNAEDYQDIDLSKTTHGMEEIAQIGFIDPSVTPLLPAFLAAQDIETQIAATRANAASGQPQIFSFSG